MTAIWLRVVTITKTMLFYEVCNEAIQIWFSVTCASAVYAQHGTGKASAKDHQKSIATGFLLGVFLFLIRDFLPLLDFFHYLHCFVFIYSGIFSSVYFFFTTKLCKIDYQANNFNTSNRRIALWIGMEALCALIQGHCLIMLTCPLAYFDIGILAVSEQKYKIFF